MPELAAEGLAKGLDEPLPAFGIAGEAADRGIQTRTRTGGPVGVDRPVGGGGGRRTNVHRVQILFAAARPATASSRLRRGRPRDCVAVGNGSAKFDRFRISDGPTKGKADRTTGPRGGGVRGATDHRPG